MATTATGSLFHTKRTIAAATMIATRATGLNSTIPLRRPDLEVISTVLTADQASEIDRQDEPWDTRCHEPGVPKLRCASRSIPGPIDFMAGAIDPVRGLEAGEHDRAWRAFLRW